MKTVLKQIPKVEGTVNERVMGQNKSDPVLDFYGINDETIV